MILLTQKVGDGPTRRCDARCYNAKGGKCECVCGGRNHCAGEQTALSNVREMFAPVVLCIHDKILGTCEFACTQPKGRMAGGPEVTRAALRHLRRAEQVARPA
jgi:hypothetical protein